MRVVPAYSTRDPHGKGYVAVGAHANVVRNYFENTGTASVLIVVGAAMVIVPEPATTTLGVLMVIAGVALYLYR